MLWYCQREEQISVTLGEARKTLQKLVLSAQEDLKAIAL